MDSIPTSAQGRRERIGTHEARVIAVVDDNESLRRHGDALLDAVQTALRRHGRRADFDGQLARIHPFRRFRSVCGG